MRLIRDGKMFEEIHRHGWPFVMQALHQHKAFDGNGLVLDDFVEATFGYVGHSLQSQHKKPWVGIFHHPVTVNSPWIRDKSAEIKTYLNRRPFIYSRETLRGAVCMSPDLKPVLEDWLNVPVLLVHHPTDLNVKQWRPSEERNLLQLGWYLRNVRLLHTFTAAHWSSYRTGPSLPWHRQRDRVLTRMYPLVNHQVTDLKRLTNEWYDEFLTTYVVCMESYGAAANNVVLECVARGTPILLNRSPATEWYLGKDYPLFFEQGSLAGRDVVIDYGDVVNAHHYIVDKIAREADLNVDNFVKAVVTFMKGL